MKTKIYLAGAMEGLKHKDYGHTWRQELIDLFAKKKFCSGCDGVDIFHPGEEENIAPFSSSKEFLGSKSVIRNGIEFLNAQFVQTMQGIVVQDLTAVANCGLLIFYYDGTHSNGGAGELTLAHYLGIPTVTLVDGVNLGDLPAWIIGCSNYIFHYDKYKEFLDKDEVCVYDPKLNVPFVVHLTLPKI